MHRGSSQSTGRGRRSLAAALAVLGLAVTGTACTNNYQTNRPYTPTDGINVDVGNPSSDNSVVHVRNLLIISQGAGQGLLSATMVTYNGDALTGVSGNAIKADGTPGAPITASLPQPVTLPPNTPVVLTTGPIVKLQCPDLQAGLDATLTLQFQKAGEVTQRILVLDGSLPQYATVSPSPNPSQSPSAASGV